MNELEYASNKKYISIREINKRIEIDKDYSRLKFQIKDVLEFYTRIINSIHTSLSNKKLTPSQRTKQLQELYKAQREQKKIKKKLTLIQTK